MLYLSVIRYPIGSPIIVTIWNVIFANKSRKLGWTWMKLGRWGRGLKRLSLAQFPAKSHHGFRRESEKMGRRGVVFCHVYDAPLLPLSSDQFPPNFPRTLVQVVARDIWFHIPEKFPLTDRISRKTLFLEYPICDQPTGNGKHSATPTLFPSPSGHPTDVPFLGNFCWGVYPFPSIHLRKWSFATVSAMGIPGWGHSSATWREAGHYSIGL